MYAALQDIIALGFETCRSKLSDYDDSHEYLVSVGMGESFSLLLYI